MIVTPTSPVVPFRLGERVADPLAMYLADIYTVTGSLAGVPGISVPSGKQTSTSRRPLPQIFSAQPSAKLCILQLAHRLRAKAGGRA